MLVAPFRHASPMLRESNAAPDAARAAWFAQSLCWGVKGDAYRAGEAYTTALSEAWDAAYPAVYPVPARPVVPAPPLTWADLVAAEPRLRTLLTTLRALDDSAPDFCANAVWYEQIKPQLIRLVGYGSRRLGDDLLSTAAAYDLAYELLYEALPDCKGCYCIRQGGAT